MLSKNLKIKLYKKIKYIRIVEELISQKYEEQNMRCPVHLSIGQEACAVGVCENLLKKDIVYSTHRPHAHYLAKNCDLKKMILEMHGKKGGCMNGRGGSMHLQDIKNGFYASIPIVGSALALAAGVSLSLKRKKSNNICTIFIGDGACEEGIFHETLNFISVKKLPLLIICENNFYSVYTHIKERQINSNLCRFAKSHGIKNLKIDGNNLLNVFKTSKLAIKYIRKYKKPFFLQLDTYRFRQHCGPNNDDYLNYRKKSEVKKWFKKCPVKNIENKLLKKKIIDKLFISKLEKKIKINTSKIFDLAVKAKLPDPKSFNKFVYSN